MIAIHVREINKEFNLAKKHFKKAVELAKKSVVVGEINFPGAEKKVRVRRAKIMPGAEGREGT